MRVDPECGTAAGGGDALVVGMGAIGAAVAAHWTAQGRFGNVWCIARSLPEARGPGMRCLVTDHSDDSLAACLGQIRSGGRPLSRVVIAIGTLHGDTYQPEKALGRLREDALLDVYRVNCVLPLRWLAALGPLLRGADDCRVTVLSARVGSIGDNRLGGWYSYRCAKAALNMGLKSAAIELARGSRGVKLIAYHPGTVDSDLSKPFQGRVPAEQLFSPAQAAAYLAQVVEQQPPDGELAYVDWAGAPIAW
jgi:NAD(P)-dependent dehydrogenase (short-subunit alcohol dehydrogenase family)